MMSVVNRRRVKIICLDAEIRAGDARRKLRMTGFGDTQQDKPPDEWRWRPE
jgi:hypothetical protein